MVNLLAIEEREKAQTFQFERDRVRYVTAHYELRCILGTYLKKHPQEVSYRYTDQGKPELDVNWPYGKISFNMSHSQCIALYAFAVDREVGVDVEFLRFNLNYTSVAQQNFSRRESELLNAASGETQIEAFFTIWTRKEAFLKAMGSGLSAPLHNFDVTGDPGQHTVLVHSGLDGQEATPWRITDLNLGLRYKGAIAASGSDWTVECFDRDSPDQTNFPGNSSFWDTVKYNPAFQGRQMRPDSLKIPVFI